MVLQQLLCRCYPLVQAGLLVVHVSIGRKCSAGFRKGCCSHGLL